MHEDLLAEQVAVITGASAGIGRATATLFAREGATVVLADVDSEGGRETAEMAREEGVAATFVETDVTDADAVASLIEACVAEYGGPDVLVNNAGASTDDERLHRLEEATWDEMLDLNLTAHYRCARAALEPMVATGGGSMVHVASVNGLQGIGLTGYSAAKSGVLGLSRVIAAQYGIHGIRSNVVCPGTIESARLAENREQAWSDDLRERFLEQYPLGRFGRPAEVATAILFLASDLSSFVTGTDLVVDGGFTSGTDGPLLDHLYDIEDSPVAEE